MSEKKEVEKTPAKKIGLGGLKKPEPPKALGFEEAPDISDTGNYFMSGKFQNVVTEEQEEE